jgi:hypothetical protein
VLGRLSRHRVGLVIHRIIIVVKGIFPGVGKLFALRHGWWGVAMPLSRLG